MMLWAGGQCTRPSTNLQRSSVPACSKFIFSAACLNANSGCLEFNLSIANLFSWQTHAWLGHSSAKATCTPTSHFETLALWDDWTIQQTTFAELYLMGSLASERVMLAKSAFFPFLLKPAVRLYTHRWLAGYRSNRVDHGSSIIENRHDQEQTDSSSSRWVGFCSLFVF